MKKMKKLVALCFVMVSGIVCAVAQDASPISIWSGVFTEEQVQQGQAAYEKHCAVCHGPGLAPAVQATPLSGRFFRIHWRKKTLAAWFDRARATMPPGRGATLSDREYLEILTYVLQYNGYPAGNRKLTPDREALQQLIFEPPPTSK
jgi:mono/diheme cytochrome c family protein